MKSTLCILASVQLAVKVLVTRYQVQCCVHASQAELTLSTELKANSIYYKLHAQS